MTDITPYVQLKTIAGYVLDENDKSHVDFDKIWLLLFRGLVDIGIDISWEPVSFNIPLEGNKTAKIPPNCMSWSKIGVWDNNGVLSTLKINNSLSIFKDNNANRLQRITADVTDNFIANLPSYPYYINYLGYGNYMPSFANSGLVQYGECRVDERNRLIVLDPLYKFDHVVLECIIAPEKNEDYEVQLSCQEALIAFANWKLKNGTERDYYNRKIEARRRLKPTRLQVIDQIIRENQGFRLKG